MAATSWTPDDIQRRFIREYGERILAEEAAVFIGAGVSRDAGFVDWATLLSEIARDLQLDISREHDLPAVAQYHYNADESRETINRTIIEAMNREAKPTEVHRIVARLPIDTIWTTNYESLIEDSARAAGRAVEVKLTMGNLAQARKGRDLVVYKMHGCVTDPNRAVLTKDDYDRYDLTRSLFTDSLKGEFVEKTFLFLGFSFTDPNIERVLARLRAQLPDNLRRHYWLTRRPKVDEAADAEKKEEQRLTLRRAEHKSLDLKKRNGIHTIWVDEYDQIPLLMRALEAYVARRGVFVSGAADDPAPLSQVDLDQLCLNVGRLIIERGGTLVSGFGRGVGEQVLLGAMRAFYEQMPGHHERRVVVRPFTGQVPESQRAEVYRRHRSDLISRVGAVVVISGNKRLDGEVQVAVGAEDEITIAMELGRVIIPVGISGHVALEHWRKAMTNPQVYLPRLKEEGELAVLGDHQSTQEQICAAIRSLLDKADHAGAAS